MYDFLSHLESAGQNLDHMIKVDKILDEIGDFGLQNVLLDNTFVKCLFIGHKLNQKRVSKLELPHKITPKHISYMNKRTATYCC